jgi:hypothetical protein
MACCSRMGPSHWCWVERAGLTGEHNHFWQCH